MSDRNLYNAMCQPYVRLWRSAARAKSRTPISPIRLIHESTALAVLRFPVTSRSPLPRDLHSFTFQLNVSTFCGIAGAFGGCLAGVRRC